MGADGLRPPFTELADDLLLAERLLDDPHAADGWRFLRAGAGQPSSCTRAVNRLFDELGRSRP